ncbi:hypothetical protein ACIQM3_10770 [Streptomyces sp. NPDC091271]|uniref:hypothetical protein n=1 Tax=Streptomyces sp. NPDC091271 TaxID=3365980 RepID=UPI0037F8004D
MSLRDAAGTECRRGKVGKWRISNCWSSWNVVAGRNRCMCQVHADSSRGGTLSDFSGAKDPDSDTAAAVKRTAQDKAGEGVGLVSDKAADAAGTAKERAGDVADEASSQVRDVAGELRDQLQDQARTQTQRLAQSVRQLADELGTMGESGEQGSPATKAVRQVADRGHNVAAKLEDRGPQGLISDLQDFARRRPGVFLAGAALAGFATARLGKGVKSASNGPASHTGDGGGDRSALGARENGWPTAVTDGQTHSVADPAGSYDQEHPTPSYGGSVSPGPLPVTDPYPNPDPQQP